MLIKTDVVSGDLFVFYGLLKQGASGMPAHIDLDAGGTFLHPVWLQGDLYDLGGFPGLVAGDGLVEGVLYRLDDVSLIEALDAFEDVLPDDPEASLYCRVRREILEQTGKPTGETGWVYWYNRPVIACDRIETGIWPLSAGKHRHEGTQP